MYYRTKNLILASFLYTVDDLEFVGINKEDLQSIIFIFKPHDKAAKYADDFFAGKGSVAPLDLFNSHKALKDLVFETKRAGGQQK